MRSKDRNLSRSGLELVQNLNLLSGEGGEERVLEECPVAENVSASAESPRPTLVVTSKFGGQFSYITTASVRLCLRAFSGHGNLRLLRG